MKNRSSRRGEGGNNGSDRRGWSGYHDRIIGSNGDGKIVKCDGRDVDIDGVDNGGADASAEREDAEAWDKVCIARRCEEGSGRDSLDWLNRAGGNHGERIRGGRRGSARQQLRESLSEPAS